MDCFTVIRGLRMDSWSFVEHKNKNQGRGFCHRSLLFYDNRFLNSVASAFKAILETREPYRRLDRIGSLIGKGPKTNPRGDAGRDTEGF